MKLVLTERQLQALAATTLGNTIPGSTRYPLGDGEYLSIEEMLDLRRRCHDFLDPHDVAPVTEAVIEAEEIESEPVAPQEQKPADAKVAVTKLRESTKAKPREVWKIDPSDHARERARERFPGYKAARIIDEVRAALAASRVSATKPPGVWNEDDPECLYAWTEDGIRVFVLTVNRYDGGQSFAVKTVLRVEHEAA